MYCHTVLMWLSPGGCGATPRRYTHDGRLSSKGGRRERGQLFHPLCTPERQSLCESHHQRRWLTHWSYCTCRCESCRRNSPFGAVVISGSPLGDRRAGSPDVKAFAQFIVVCSASILAEKLRMSSPLSSQSCENKGGSLRPTRAYICQVKPSTNPDNLSG